MWQRLIVRKHINHRPKGLPPHEGCSSYLNMISLQSPDKHLMALFVRSELDRECCNNWSRPSEATSNNFSLSLTLNQSHFGHQRQLNNSPIEIPPKHYLLANPLDVTDLCPNQLFNGTEFFLYQSFLRDFREVIGLPKSMGPFDFSVEPRPIADLTPALSVFDELFRRVVVKPSEWDVWAPLALISGYSALMETLWTHHPSGLRRRLEELGYQKELDPRLLKAVDYLGTHFAQPIINSAVAKTSGVSESGLHRLFKEYFQLTPHDYLRRLRVQKAKEWLAKAPKQDWQAAAEHVGLGSAWALKKALKSLEIKT